jgi:CBS domain-containing protein
MLSNVTVLYSRPSHRKPRVQDCMTRDPVVVEEGAKLADALALMQRYGIRRLPVVAEDGALVGLLRDRELRDALPSSLPPGDPAERTSFLQRTGVLEVAQRSTSAIDPAASVVEAIVRMRRLRVGSLPVVENGKLVGILTAGDLIKLLERLLVTSS